MYNENGQKNGRKKSDQTVKWCEQMEIKGDKRKMTQEQIKAKAKEYFPNDEFKQQIVIDAINWATKELQKENAELKKLKRECETSLCRAEYQYNYEQLTKAKELLKRYVPYRQITDSKAYKDLAEETEQFLSEVNK